MHGTSRAFRVVALVLLVVCFAQAAWWIVDEASFTARVNDRLRELYAADADAARDLVRRGVPAGEIRALFPHVDLAGDAATVRPEALEAIAVERDDRLRRFGWEGAFFLVVLASGMAVIVQALRSSSALLRRQQNFLASVSHELKSPLASMRLSAETLLLRRPEPERVQALAERIVRDTDRLSTMVTNLLDVARIEEGGARVDPETQPLAPLVDAALEEVRPELAGVEVRRDLAPGLSVRADAAAFRTCLRNLVSNAAKSTLAAGADPPEVRLSAARRGGRVELVVADRGLGFERGEAARIFDKFYRTGDEMRRTTKGSGLGLYLVRRLARLHGAEVRGESPGPGGGATFTLTWPAGDAREDAR